LFIDKGVSYLNESQKYKWQIKNSYQWPFATVLAYQVKPMLVCFTT